MEQKDLLSGVYTEGRGTTALPNATASLVLGILSLVLSLLLWCLFYVEILPLILGIIGMVLAGKDKKLYDAAPEMYSRASYNNSNAGKICSIIAVCISLLVLVVFTLIIIAAGSMTYSGW
jgi:hypothetical protein